jgi:cytochrome c peroxidase
MRTLVVALWLTAFVIHSGPGAATSGPGVPPAPLGLDLYRPVPADNPLTPEKVALGRRLFHDRRLSAHRALSCAVCHDSSRGFSNGRTVAVGAGGVAGRRNVPTLINRVYGATFFWDGRARSLEQQVVQPLVDPHEMAATPDAIMATLRGDGGYRRQFMAAFGRAPVFDDLARALASYVRTIRSGNSRYDQFRHGSLRALNGAEQRGMRLFLGKANCWACHSGSNLSDERFHNTGIAFREGRLVDRGRFTVTGREADRGAFKTPTLREIARTAPYMHDGSLPTIESVIEYYNRGGNANAGLDAEIRPLTLSVDDRRALAAFLRALSGTVSEGS